VQLNEPRLARLAAFFGVVPANLSRAMEAWATRHGPRPLERVAPPPDLLDEADDLGPPAA
jgi:hypothetical protein